MSLDAAKEFLKKAESDATLKEKIDGVDGADVVKLAASMGHNFTVEELETALDEVYGELSDEDLEAVDGGLGGLRPSINITGLDSD